MRRCPGGSRAPGMQRGTTGSAVAHGNRGPAGEAGERLNATALKATPALSQNYKAKDMQQRTVRPDGRSGQRRSGDSSLQGPLLTRCCPSPSRARCPPMPGQNPGAVLDALPPPAPGPVCPRVPPSRAASLHPSATISFWSPLPPTGTGPRLQPGPRPPRSQSQL